MSIRLLTSTEWRLLRDARLGALRDSPAAFLSTYETEVGYGRRHWLRELARGCWLVSSRGTEIQAVLGATPESDVDPADRYLSFLWVAPDARRGGIATRLVDEMLDHLRAHGVGRAWLWVLDGNEPAYSLYRKLGFVSTGVRQPLRHDPTRCEERLTRPVVRSG